MKEKVLIDRTKQWWRAKAGYLCSLLLFLLAVYDIPFQQGAYLLFLAITAILGIGIVGHLINDFSDIEPDRIVGKSNIFISLGKGKTAVLFLFFIGLGYSPWFFGFQSNLLIRLLLVAELLLFLVYSFPPFRFKNYPVVAVIMDALYAYVNPALFLWLSFQFTLGIEIYLDEIILLLGVGFLLGIRHILNHHVVDRTNDQLANSPNIAVNYGSNGLYRTIRYFLLPVELMSVFAFLLVIGGGNTIAQAASIIGFTLVILLSGNLSFPFIQVRFGELLHDRFYTQLLGLIAIGVLIYHELTYLVLLPVFLVVFTDVFKHPIWRWILLESWSAILIIVKWPFSVSSLIFNWSIYYFRKWVLQWSEERNWGEHYEKRLENLHLDKRGTIAIFNQNFAKYSETFIEGQLEYLDYRKLYFYGNPSPMTEKRYGNLVSSNEYIRGLRYALVYIMNQDSTQFENRLIAAHLIDNEVDLLMAHFGPMGVRLVDVSIATGIPLIVVFHGYDTWNSAEVSKYGESYKRLFRHAVHVVGVSKDICDRLVELGCPKDKINYLPAHVSPKYFIPVNRKEPAVMTFLCVGRFAITKAPHLVLESFRKVVRKLPQSKLVMIGADDGGNLYETCVAMVRAFGLEKNVELKGVMNSDCVLNEMLNSTIFVQHSITTPLTGDKEGTPVGVMEAMLLGLPIVATNHAGIGEMIKHGVSGLLIKEYDIEGMAESMIQLALSDKLRKQLGENAAKAIRDMPKVMKNTDLFSEIIDKSKP